MSERLYAAALRRPGLSVAASLAACAAAALPVGGMDFDESLSGMVRQDDPDLRAYREFLRRFESDEVLVVAVGAPDVFAPEVLAAIDRLTRRLQGHPGAEEVVSVTNLQVLADDGAGGLVLQPALDGPPADPGARARARERALASPLVRGSLVSADGRTASVLVRIAPVLGADSPRGDAAVEMRRAAREELSGLDAHVASASLIGPDFAALSMRDVKVLVPPSLLLTALVLYLAFRRGREVAVPLVSVAAATAATFGLVAAAGRPYTIILSVLPPILLVVGLEDAVHLCAELGRERGGDARAAVLAALARVMPPCAVTTLTTAAGFASLATSSITYIRDLGLAAAAGVILEMVLTVTLVAPGLLLWPARGRRAGAAAGAPARAAVTPAPVAPAPSAPAPSADAPGRGARWLGAVADLALRRRGRVIAVAAALVVAAVAGIPRIHVEHASMSFLPRDHELRRAFQFVDGRLAGTNSLEVVVEGTREGELIEPAALARLDALAARLAREPRVARVTTVADHLREAARALGESPPRTREQAAQLLLLAELGGYHEPGRYLTDEGRTARVSARVRIGSSREFRELVRAAEGAARDAFGREARVTVTGSVRLFVNLADYVIGSTTWSSALAFPVVSAAMLLLFRSAFYGLLSMIPNVLPLVLVFGLMGWSGIPLSISTAMLAAVMLGLVDDITVHFLYRYREERRAGRARQDAARAAVTGVGGAMVATTAVLAAGNGVLLLSDYKGTQQFAVLAIATFVSALGAGLLLMPAAMSLRAADGRRGATARLPARR